MLWVEICQEEKDDLIIVKEGCRLRNERESLRLKMKKQFN